jgi:hypothetical protein
LWKATRNLPHGLSGAWPKNAIGLNRSAPSICRATRAQRCLDRLDLIFRGQVIQSIGSLKRLAYRSLGACSDLAVYREIFVAIASYFQGYLKRFNLRRRHIPHRTLLGLGVDAVGELRCLILMEAGS